MLEDTQQSQLTARHILVPIAVLAVTLALLLAFQTKQIMRERDSLHEVMGQQEKPFEDSQRLQAQLTALVSGTEKLADSGNASAKEIAERLKKLGVGTNNGAKADSRPPAPVPAASEQPEPGPVKP